jgi:hypothetical protein
VTTCFALVGLGLLAGCSGADGTLPGNALPAPPAAPMASTPPTMALSDAEAPSAVPDPPDAEASQGEPFVGYQGPEPEAGWVDPPPSPTPVPAAPLTASVPDASAVVPPAGPVVIVCVVPGASVRYVCDGTESGTNSEGIEYTLANGGLTPCGWGTPAMAPCPSGAGCTVSIGNNGESQAGTCSP